jgi:hypothetical protein
MTKKPRSDVRVSELAVDAEAMPLDSSVETGIKGRLVKDSAAVYRVNARFDEDMNTKIAELSAHLGLSTSDVLREAVSQMYTSVSQNRSAGRVRIEALIGKYTSFDPNLSASYKAGFTQALVNKHGLRQERVQDHDKPKS